MRLFFKILSQRQLRRLSEHSYCRCSSTSILDPLVQPWWNWLVNLVPVWLAPNLITVLGLLVNVLTAVVLVLYSPDAKVEPPRWACLLAALGLFVYQSLDAVDGKQARRTRTTTPLGELFDHGCDSVSTVFITLSTCIVVQLGYYPMWMFFQCFCAMTLFYCAHWQTYVSGSLTFGKVNVTETQLIVILIHIISAIFGPAIWKNEIPMIKGFQFKYLIGVMTVACSVANLLSIFLVIFTVGFSKKGSTVYGKSALLPIIPFSFIIVLAFVICSRSVEQVYENYPVLYLLSFGMVAAKITNRLVVAHMSKSEIQYLDRSFFGPAVLFFNQSFNNFIAEYYVLWFCFLWVTIDLLIYSVQVCTEICDYLDIKLFKIPIHSHRHRGLLLKVSFSNIK